MTSRVSRAITNSSLVGTTRIFTGEPKVEISPSTPACVRLRAESNCKPKPSISCNIRRRILQDMEGLGLQLDSARNRTHAGVEGEISTFGSPVKILVVPTNEELVIARETREVIQASGERS